MAHDPITSTVQPEPVRKLSEKAFRQQGKREIQKALQSLEGTYQRTSKFREVLKQYDSPMIRKIFAKLGS